jgi:hypothetical protein
MQNYPEMDYKELEAGFRELAVHANATPRPEPPELVPGLDGVNALRLRDYHNKMIAWVAGKTEALMQGLPREIKG